MAANQSSSYNFNLHGYDIALNSSSGKLNARELKERLGTHGISKPRAEAVLSVLLVKDDATYEWGGPLHSSELLLGEGFALNYAERTLYWPRTAPRRMHMKNLGDQNPLTRTIVFSIALLAEHNGLETVAQKTSQFQAPLYLHASSILTPKGALVFCGECTFGKTTISTKLLNEYPLLEDDQVTILLTPPGTATARERQTAPRVVVFGDSRKKNAKKLKITTAPLRGIFWLKKDLENAFEKIDQAEAAALMLNPMVNWQNAFAIKQRLRLFKALFSAVPCRRLAFKKESAALVEFLKRESYA
jgi:hypothetical protein